MANENSSVTELTDQNFRATLASKPLAFVDIFASWCGPCRLFAPTFEKVAAKHPEAAFFKIDGDQNAESRSDLSIDNLPYVAVFRNGNFITGFSTTSEDAFEEFVQKHAGSQS